MAAAGLRGLPVIAATCPEYFLLSDERYEEPGFHGAKYVNIVLSGFRALVERDAFVGRPGAGAFLRRSQRAG